MFFQSTADVVARNPLLRVVMGLTLLSHFVPSLTGQTNSGLSQSGAPPGVGIHMDASPQSATVGDPVTLRLDITMPPGYRAEVRAIEKEIGDFSVIEFSPGPSVPAAVKPESPGAGNTQPAGMPVNQRVRITVAAYRTGTLTFPPVPIIVHSAEGKEFAVSSPPVKIEIRSVLTGKNSDLKDLKKQAEIPEKVRWGLWLSVALALLAVAVLAWRVWKRRHRRAQAIPAAPPQDLLDAAETELRELLARGLPSGQMVKPFYIRLSDIAKKMLEAGYEIHASERTTFEILNALQNGRRGAEKDMELIESLLDRCDLVKFAKYVPSTAEHESAAKDSLKVLETVRKLVLSRSLSNVQVTAGAGSPVPVKDTEDV